jgi:outer membrane cobalamin receptor
MSYGEKQEYKNVVWQYILDHALVQKDGYMRILFYIKDKKDFDKRVMYRLRGFKRYDEEDFKEASNRRLEEVNKWKNTYNYHLAKTIKINKRIEEIKVGKLRDKLLFWFYKKIKNYLFKK